MIDLYTCLPVARIKTGQHMVIKHQRGAVRAVMDMSLFVLLLLSWLLCSAYGVPRKYNFINQNMTWAAAQSYCRERFTDLATVDSIDDVNRTVNTVNDGYSGSVWIGLKRGTQHRWVWCGENTISEYINWEPGQPNQPLSEFCVFSSNGGWHDMPCKSVLPFVCYNENGYIMVNSYKNWTDAQSYCRQYHTDLATIHSLEEQNQQSAVVGSGQSVWIGLSLDSWQWSDQWNLIFRNWAAGYTSQTSESGDCAVMSTTDSGKWIQDSCDLHHPFLCYGRPKPLYRPHHYINTRMSWSEAQSYCRERFTDLATVDSMDDVNRMINKVNDGYSTSVWIGLKRATQSRWGWSMGDTLTQYTGWKSGKPNGDGVCGELNNGEWNDLPCSTNYSFVCYNETIGNILIQTLKNWRDAQSYCRQYHTDLATISSPEEQQQLNNLAGYTSHVWIGLFSDSWQWSDQWSLFFRNWAAGQPSTSGECVAMSSATPGKWAHDSCNLKRPFFCHGWPKPLYRHYHYINESRSWSDAQSYCRERFTDLATVDSIDDVNRTVNTVNDGYSGSVWIGLKRATQSRWVWSMENNTLSQYINWKAGEPNFDGECVGSSNGSWFDETCSTLLPFVCYNGTAGFIFINMTLTWRDAQNYCRQHHTDLASVSSPEQQRLINDKSSVWIGLFLHSWQWSDDWSLSFRYWTTGQPSNSSASGNCVAMTTNDSGKWVYDNCDQKFPFICHGRPKPLYRLYHYINTTLSWSEAQSYCRERFTDLATVDSMNDVNRTINKVNDGYSGSVWIGLKRATRSRWGWSNGDDSYTQYRGWGTGEPHGDGECCELKNGAWNDLPCSTDFGFVCYNETIGNILIKTLKNWTDAQSYCRQYHTDLATISSPEEQQQLYNLARNVSRVWIGLFSDSWQWSDQWSLFFRNWAAVQPSTSGDCVAMSTTDSGKWTQYSCDHQRPFICYGRPKLHRHYLYVNNKMSWSEAQSYCRERFTDLATVDSMNDVNKLMNTVKSWYSGSLWIGLKRTTQSRWLWSSGYDTLKQFSGWQSGEPNGDPACVFFANGFWSKYSCSNRLFFVCYNGIGNIVIPIWNNWTDAQSYCRQYHTDLATISSPEEQKQLYSVVGNGPWVWIGLFFDSWQWSDQWSLFNFRYWETGYTSLSSGSGNCVAMSTTDSGKWIQDSCDLHRPFLCYGRPKPLYRPHHYINTRMSWSEAQIYCRERFTDLATVDSIDDVNRMINKVNDGYSTSVWIGLKRATQSRWGWSMGDTLTQYTGWKSGKPNGDGVCGELNSGEWNDLPCSTNYSFVCYNETIGNILIQTLKNWRDAQSYCRQYHTDLATISSPEEQQQLYNLAGYTSHVWIGLFSDSWQWSDQWSLFFRNWAAGQPSTSGECVAMSTTDSGKWAHDSCNLKRPFFCHGWPKPLYRHYHYINESRSWSDAQSYCRERFTDLATVDSIDDVNRTVNTVNDGYSGSVWIGLKRATQSRWVWSMENNTLSQYINWKAGEPNFDGECVGSSNGSWFDETCSTLLPFVCYNSTAGFIFINMTLTWRDAQNYCRQHHTDLASVSSAEQQRLINDKSSVWIGLFLHSWQWSDDWSLSFRYWTTGQPSNSSASGNCVAMTTNDSGKWVYDNCDQKFPFICHGRPKPLYRLYHYINTTLSWSEAQSYCRERFTDLATVDSMNDVNRTINKVNDGYSGSVWIGLKRATRSRWGWSNGDDSYTQYRGWGTGEPHGDGECCELKNGAWNDLPCSTDFGFVCYNETIGNILIKTLKNWTDAQSYCRQYHTDLATISSPEEQQQLYNLARNVSRVWIGLFSDSWQWSDQWSLFFRNWAAVQPSTSGDCVAMSTTDSGKWTQYSCDHQRPFICYGRPKLHRHYLYVNNKMSWSEAQSYCRERFTDLATVDSMNDVNKLMNTVKSWYSGSLWIGLKRTTQSRWLWSSGYDTLKQFSGWQSGEPNGDPACVFFANGFWSKYSCSNRLFFVCYNGIGNIVIPIWKNWTDAQSYCRQYHTDLATISSPEEQKQLYSVVGNGPWVWIGLFFDSWQWSDQWSLFNFRYWETGYTSLSSGSGNCVAMSTTDSGKWIQDSCDLHRPFLCYGRPKPLYRPHHYINTRMSWSEAQIYCRERFTDLATVDSIDDVNRMINKVNDGYSTSVWIGLKRATQSRWGWSMGDTLTQYTGWKSGKPNGDGVCGELNSGEWNDLPCSTNYSFVCYNETIGNILIQTLKNWRDAQSYCRQYHTDLATISSPEEQQQLYNLAGYTSHVWIGLFSDSWQWSDQWSLFFRNWAAGQPSTSGECVAMSTTDSGKWAHDSCNLKRPFFCHGWPKPLYRHYHYINESRSWSDAQSYCRERFTDLATVDSIDDVNRTVNTVNDGYSGSVWIGLKRATQSRWVWSMENNTLSQYINWKAGEPNFDGECVGSSNGSWFDETCSTLLPFVCYNGTAGFIFINMTLTWRDAQNYCRQHHTDLASVSIAEQQRLINDKSSVWIGLFLHSWQWSDDWSLSFRYWTTGQPSNSSASGNCVAMTTNDSGKWVYDNCDQKFPFICHGRPKPLYRLYHYINTTLSWSEAQSYCRERFTDLATVDSMNDVNRTINKVNDGYSGSVWIGLKRATRSRWGWSNGDDTYTQYRGWGTGEPHGDGECCELKNGAWNDLPCSTDFGFVCYNETIGNILIKTLKNWTDAQSYCRQYHTDLATISSPEEQQQLYNLARNVSRVWIGLFSDPWQWSDQWSLFFRNWAAVQPSTSGDCVAMSTTDSGKWTQYSCDHQRPFICYGRPKLHRHYLYVNNKMSWSEAQGYCRERFTDLATVDSMNDVNKLMNTVKSWYSGSLWIGLKRTTQSRWLWSSGYDTLKQFSGWQSGEPNGDPACVFFANGFWSKYSCSNRLFFVCYNGIRNIVIPIWKNWTDAQSYCRQYHIDLATISSPEEQKQLYSVVGNGPWVWIGLFFDSWQWSDQWSLFNFRYWATGYTSLSSGSGHCVAMSTTDSGKWIQNSCDEKFPFICYGNDELIKRQIGKLLLSCDVLRSPAKKCSSGEPLLKTAILNKIAEINGAV
ncbi:uncharacterized protein LOC130417612 isoform X3 [Triplophysa dalaica]|uniref:uncharacterized protein LOC130417612 isoform X3 n=1 Tax=Triplophysa dalaica TaxID=1582913 RepID=UPI0024DFB7D6|nr:uncharacterized protein LOC130417612 isoform X3 [Triplophysa dalaica]